MTAYLLCPACETGELRPDPFLVRCSGCEYALSRDLFLTLRRIRALPEAPALMRRRGRPHDPEGGLMERSE